MTARAPDPSRYLRHYSVDGNRKNRFRRGLLTRTRFSARMRTYFLINRDYTIEHEGRPIGRKAAKVQRNLFGRALNKRLDDLKEGRAEGYVLIENCVPVPYGFSQKQDRIRGHQSGRPAADRGRFRLIDSFATGLLHRLGSTPVFQNEAQKQQNLQIARDLRSAPGQAELPERDGSDMPLRFHQSLIERGFPKSGGGIDYGETCVFKTYIGLRNWRKIPIYLLQVKDVIACIPEEVRETTIAQLKREAFTIAWPLSDSSYNAFARQQTPGLPLLVEGRTEDDWLMSFDPNRVIGAPDEEAEDAIGRLRAAIDNVQITGKCVRVVVTFRDILIVDNLRVLVSRREFDPKLRDLFRMTLGWRDRWLRQLYGAPHHE